MADRTRMRVPQAHAAPLHNDVAHNADLASSNSADMDVGYSALLERVTKPILAVTYWFDPAPHPHTSPVSIRFSGRRLGVEGKAQPGDAFVHDETIDEVIRGSGPISLTARICDLNPGEWAVTARELGTVPPPRTRQERRVRQRQRQAQAQAQEGQVAAAAAEPGLAARFWRRWAPPVGSSEGVPTHARTCYFPFARVPGIIPGIWAVLVTLGIALALALQALLAARDHLTIGRLWPIWLVALAAGIVGAKAWFMVLHWDDHSWDGWCIQGFISAATATAAILLLVLLVPAGIFLDALAPALLFGLAVGRVGCFFAGCCGGPPTASRWGMWSSDMRVGARRIPTQLLESALALTLGLITLAALLRHGPAGGALFVAGVAAYTLGRQGILRLRAELRRTRVGLPITAALAALVLVAAVVAVLLRG